MSLPGFHPIVSDWFTARVGTPTPAQTRGWAAIREGRHTLIAAPTGSGKTLAAFLTALDALVRDAETRPLPDEVRVVYVSPMKALSAAIHTNLAERPQSLRKRVQVQWPCVLMQLNRIAPAQAHWCAPLAFEPRILMLSADTAVRILLWCDPAHFAAPHIECLHKRAESVAG